MNPADELIKKQHVSILTSRLSKDDGVSYIKMTRYLLSKSEISFCGMCQIDEEAGTITLYQGGGGLQLVLYCRDIVGSDINPSNSYLSDTVARFRLSDNSTIHVEFFNTPYWKN